MTSQGSASGRFTRAIKQRNLFLAEMAIREMGGVASLHEGLDYLDLLAEESAPREALSCSAVALGYLADDLKKDDGPREQRAERQRHDRLDAEHEELRTKPVARTEGEEPHGITLSSRSVSWEGRAPPHRARQSHHRGGGPLHTITLSGLSGSVHSGRRVGAAGRDR
jgi:hypothetical protein